MTIVILVFSIIQAIVVLFGFYHGFISLFGLRPPRKSPLMYPTKRFAVIVAAHNEENVIKGAIDSIKKQNYPLDMFDTLVICDNCSDRTAEVVRSSGVLAFERVNELQKGKGYALV